MASKIEHIVKKEAYSDALAWSRGVDKESIIWWLQQKVDSHKGHLTTVGKKSYMGTAPKSRVLNWVAHRLLCWAWGSKSYFGGTISRDYSKTERVK